MESLRAEVAHMTNRKAKPRIIDADGHVRETDEEVLEFKSAGYRSRRDAMLYFPLTPHHGWHRSIVQLAARQRPLSGAE